MIGVLGLARSPLAPTRLVSLEDLVRAAVAAAYPRTRPPRPDCPGESPVRTLESPLSDGCREETQVRSSQERCCDGCVPKDSEPQGSERARENLREAGLDLQLTISLHFDREGPDLRISSLTGVQT